MRATQDQADAIETTLTELSALHEREAVVLRKMDRAALDVITGEKDHLCSRLRELVAQRPLEARHRALLERVRRQASHNQLLVVHARDAVRTILSEASGTPIEAMPTQRKAAVQDGLRLNVRG